LLNPLNSNLYCKAIAIFFFSPALVSAQDTWQLTPSFNAMTGQYADSRTMNNQQGLGVRISGEKERQWGFTAGLQTTHIDMAPITQTSVQHQDNWLASTYTHLPSSRWLGRWTLQIDTHKVNNDALHTNSNSVRALAPQITWLSNTQPLKMDLSLAKSNYANSEPIYQLSSAVAYGFNNATNWLQIRGYAINNLTPSEALGLSNTRAVETKFTHVLGHTSTWMPTSITVGLDHGKRIYWVDMASQTIYNQPMINEGSENIAASWQLNPKTKFNLQLNQTRYYAESLGAHRFKLSTLSTQLAFAR
jgi:hypothetical protein